LENVANVEKVEILVRELNYPAPQVRIEAKLLEVSAELLAGLVTLTPNPTNGSSRILKAKEAKELMRKLEHLEGVDMLASPKMITLSGSHAQFSVTHMQTFVTGVKAVVTNGVTNQVPQTEAMQFGLMVDLLAVALPDGFTWERVEVPHLEVSSTDLRARVTDGRPLDLLLPGAVIEGIRTRNLYGTP